MDPAVQAYIKSPTQPKQYFDTVNQANAWFGDAPLRFRPIKGMPTDAHGQESWANFGDLPTNWAGADNSVGSPFKQGTMYRARTTGDVRKDTPGAAPYYRQANQQRRNAWAALNVHMPDDQFNEWQEKGWVLPMAPPRLGTVELNRYDDLRQWSKENGKSLPYAAFNHRIEHTVPNRKVFATTDPNNRPESTPRYSFLTVTNQDPTGAVAEENNKHRWQNPAAVGWSISRRFLGDDPGSEAARRLANGAYMWTTSGSPMAMAPDSVSYPVQLYKGIGQSYMPTRENYNASRWVYPTEHLANNPTDGSYIMNYTPAAYTYAPAELTKSLDFVHHQLRHKYGQQFNSFSDVIPYLHQNGFFKGGRIDENKFGNLKESGGSNSPLYGELFGQYRDLSDNLMLAQAAYKRDPNNPIVRRNYASAQSMYNDFMISADHYWKQLMPQDPIGAAAKQTYWDPNKSPATAKVNADNAIKFYKNRSWIPR